MATSQLDIARAAAFRGALAAADYVGRLPAATARTLRAGVETSLTTSVDPERLLGPFDALPSGVQRSLISEVEADERWRLRGYELGGWHCAVVRLVRSRPYKLLTKSFSSTSVLLLRDGPQKSLYALYGAAARWKGRHASRPSAGSLLRAVGLDPRVLTVYYARGLAQPTGYRGFWHDSERNVTVGCVLGVDLIPTTEGFWYVESNLNAGIRPERTALYEKDDPFVVNLCRFAQEGGYRRLIVVLQNGQRVDPVMARRYEEESAARKMQLTLLEDSYLLPGRNPQTYRVPQSLDPDTLVVRMKNYRTNLDYVIHNKRGSHRALRIYQERSADRDVRLPLTSDDPVASEYDPRQPFPNLVYKLPERDRKSGVVFLKASSLENARELVSRAVKQIRPARLSDRLSERVSHLFDDTRGVFQPYIVGSMLEGRRLYTIRAHVLLTPVGACDLSAHRIVGGTPVPRELAEGIVQDQSPYLWTLATGARLTLAPSQEETGAGKAALAVARGLSAAIAYGFQTCPKASPELS